MNQKIPNREIRHSLPPNNQNICLKYQHLDAKFVIEKYEMDLIEDTIKNIPRTTFNQCFNYILRYKYLMENNCCLICFENTRPNIKKKVRSKFIHRMLTVNLRST